MKNERKVVNEAVKSKMSLAAEKAWKTRRNGMKKKENRKKSKKHESKNNENVSVEQLKKGYRKGMLMNKAKRAMVHRSSVKLTGKNADKEFMEFLLGEKHQEQALIGKLVDIWWRKAKAKSRFMRVPKVLVVQ